MVALTVFDLFKIGIGPSSSHTVGPMVAAHRFARGLAESGALASVSRVKVELFGSLGATGRGHGSVPAVAWGLEGELPESIDLEGGPRRTEEVRATGRLVLNASGSPRREIGFDLDNDIVLHRHRRLPFHPNAMVCTAFDGDTELVRRTFYSVGGGTVVDDDGSGQPVLAEDSTEVRYPFRTGVELLERCRESRLSISQVMLANECAFGPEADVRRRLDELWAVMTACVRRGQTRPGTLPGGLSVRRRAPELHARLLADAGRFRNEEDPLAAMDWVTLWALAVNEENAAGGRVVTAPTNGAAGIIPAVLHYAVSFVPGTDAYAVQDFLLTAGAIGTIYIQTASISGAEVGCQGEVGSACSMAAAGLAQILGASPEQVECAAEIGMEHHLGLTCDPAGGLVQIPCIERNAVASVKAITAARLALYGDGTQKVSLDQVVRTMMQTGADMGDKYKETARGGLAVNIVEC